MVWSLALCPDDTKQDSVVYGAEFGVVLLAKGPRTASIQQEDLDCLGLVKGLNRWSLPPKSRKTTGSLFRNNPFLTSRKHSVICDNMTQVRDRKGNH